MMRYWPLLFVTFLAGCGSGGESMRKATWPAPPNPMVLARAAGLTPETQEFTILHVHSHLDVFLDGESVAVPAGIGINIDDPAVKNNPLPDGTDDYGGIVVPCKQPCISTLHTHSVDGVLHTEAKNNKFNALGQLFTEWDVRLDENCVGDYCRPETPVAFYVNGQKYQGDPRKIQLTDAKEIAVVIGSPPDTIPSTFTPGG